MGTKTAALLNRLAIANGWVTETVILILCAFVERSGLADEFVKFAAQVANQGEGALVAPSGKETDA